MMATTDIDGTPLIIFGPDEAMILRDALEDHRHHVTHGGYGECPPALNKLIDKMDNWLEENL
jgi:hypothetical protein